MMAKCLSRDCCGIFFVQEVCFGTLGPYFGSLNCKYTLWTPFLAHLLVSKWTLGGPWGALGVRRPAPNRRGEVSETPPFFLPFFGLRFCRVLYPFCLPFCLPLPPFCLPFSFLFPRLVFGRLFGARRHQKVSLSRGPSP